MTINCTIVTVKCEGKPDRMFPRVPIQVADKKGSAFTLNALIDADLGKTRVPSDLAERLGIEHQTLLEFTLEDCGQKHHITVPITIEDKNTPLILGKEVFLDHFTLTIENTTATLAQRFNDEY